MNNEKRFIVYMHTSPNNKIYIGITSRNPKKRWRSDGSGYKSNDYFWRAIQKYGWENFKHEILFDNLTQKEAEQKEMELIARYKSNNKEFGYNIANGGNCVGTFSEETKSKISKAITGIKRSKETKQKIKEAKTGTTLSEEHKKKIGESLKGHATSVETRKKISESHKGKHHTEETKRKLSEINKGRKGTPMSEEHKKYLSYLSSHRSKELQEKINNAKKKPIIQLSKEKEYIQKFDSSTDAQAQLGINKSNIVTCLKGRQKTAGGYIWMYESDYNESLNYNK